MHLLIVSLCVITSVLIVLDATPCSTEKKREMLIKVCGHYRTKRGTSFNEFQDNGKGMSKHQSGSLNDLHSGETRHHKHYHIVANDTTGGILIRRKRGASENYMYCCLDMGNCTFVC